MRNQIVILIVLILFTSCNLSDDTKKLSGGWLYVSESTLDKVIDGGYAYIPCEVTHYGFDADFIIAAQKPSKECFLGQDVNNYRFGRDSIYYWIVVHKQKQLIGPLELTEFKKARDSLNVPNSVKLELIK